MSDVVSFASARGTPPAVKRAETKVEKLDARRIELAEATLETLAELGYARTSLREIANNSQFSHGVLHYYFNDKIDLICCAVRYYKATCVTRYDEVIATATTTADLVDGFCEKLRDTLTNESRMHRLWYDLRSQALFEGSMRKDVMVIDQSLEDMIWRVAARYASLETAKIAVSRSALYALFDGLFQRHLMLVLGGDLQAPDKLIAEIRQMLPSIALAT